MPNILDPNKHNRLGSPGLKDVRYDYDYPDGLDFQPGSKLHERIKREVLRRAQDSYSVMQARFDSWNKIDETLTCYMTLDESESKVQAKDSRKPVSIVVPYSYATLETILTYLMAAFFREPIFLYEGVSPEDTIGAILLEKVVDLHVARMKVALSLHTIMRDSLAYGIGIGAPSWKRIHGRKIVKREVGFWSFLGKWISKGWDREMVEAVLFEGNALASIDPYRFLPDPNVPIQRVQDGAYVGWVERTDVMNLLSDEHTDPDVFNAKYVRHIDGRSYVVGKDDHARDRKFSATSSDTVNNDTAHPVDVIHMYIKVIPKEWGLSDRDRPEKWHFAVAGDEVVLCARPLGLAHDLFPIVTCAPDFDGYSVTPISRLEIVNGLQHTLNWLFNAHITNVRKAINDMLIVDPQLVNMEDLADPKPGKIIRLRKSAWGRGVTNAVQQLAINDVTRQHITDSSYVIDLMQRCSAATDNLMGIMRPGSERRSATEARGTMASAMSRMESMARVIGLQLYQDLGYFFASHTQQFMEEEVYIKASGRWQETLQAEFGVSPGSSMKVSPFDVLIDYDVKVRDGTVQGANWSDVWVQMFQVIAGNPELLQKFDVVRIFQHIARSLGAKNVEDFVRQQPAAPAPEVQTQVLPDEQIQALAEAGMAAPVEALA